ncbi:MAG: hypothetical protein IJR59_02460 [Firmicutes bacterium]|nr:hypothetical protein [Bacillota bacterium]
MITETQNSETGWCVDTSNDCVYLIFKLRAAEEDFRNYDHIAIKNSENEIMVTKSDLTEGTSGYNGEYTEVYKKIEFGDNDCIEVDEDEYLLGFRLTGIKRQPQNFTISAEAKQ